MQQIIALLEDQAALGLEGVPLALLREPAAQPVAYGNPVSANLAPAAPLAAPMTSGSTPPATARAPAPAGTAVALHTQAQQGDLSSIRAEIGDCTRCKLHKGRKTIV